MSALCLLTAAVHAAVLSDLPAAPCPSGHTSSLTCDVADKRLREYLQREADSYCAEAGQNASSMDFFYARLPAAAFADLPHCGSGGQYSDSLGALWMSGYWGGLWLASIIEGKPTALPRALVGMHAGLSGVRNFTAGEMLKAVGSLVNAANDSDTAAVEKLCLDVLPAFTVVDAYNYGYLVAVREIRNISAADPAWLHCAAEPEYMCRVPGFSFDDHYFAEVQSKFDHASPSSLRWDVVKAALQNPLVNVSVADGHSVWQRLGKFFHGEALVQLDLLGRKFLAIAEGATSGCAVGYADRSDAAGRCGLDSVAGMVSWAGSYFLGLATLDAKRMPQPTLQC